MLADGAPEVCGQDVLRMHGVSVKRGAVAKDGDEPSMIGARKMKRVKADGKTFYPFDHGRKTAQARDMFLAYRLLDVGAIFPDDDMRKHSFGPTFLSRISSSGLLPYIDKDQSVRVKHW